MAYDLVLKDGMVVDGTGLPRYRADIGIRDGRIVEKGRLSAGSAKVINAEGKIVAPGFVDLHTHYDAQVLWDPLLTCSPWHGTTTVIMGNCGYSLAPVREQDQQYLRSMFAQVEGVNLNALEIGLDFRWESFPEYLEHIRKGKIGINVGTMVGHSAIRRYVMGEAAHERRANADEVQQMKQIVREAIANGAFGFTTSLSPTHIDMDGRPVPSRQASHEEVLELGSTLSEFHIGSVGIITETAAVGADGFSEADQKLMTKLSMMSGRPVNWNGLSHSWGRPNAWRQQLAYMARASQQGAQVYAICHSERLDIIFNLSDANAFDRWPKWKETLKQTKAKAMKDLNDTKVRAALKADAEQADASLPAGLKLTAVTLVRSKTGRFAADQGRTIQQLGQAQAHGA